MCLLRRFTPEPRAMTHFWVTDSCPQRASELAAHAPFEVLSIAPLVAWLLAEPGTDTA